MCDRCTGRPTMIGAFDLSGFLWAYDVREHIPAAFSGTVPVITSVR